MAKFCPNCGNEMVDEAVMCVKCGTMIGGNTNNNANVKKDNKVKKKGLPVWAIILIVFGSLGLLVIVAIIILTIIGINAIKNEDPSQIKDKIDGYIEENTTSLYGTIDDTLSDGNFNLTLIEALKYDSIGEGNFIDTPEEGKEYLLFFFDVENISDDNKYISYYDFDGYVDDVACDTAIIFNNANGVDSLAVNLASGKKAQGFVAFEVPKGWKSFEVHYKKIFSNKSLIFKVVNSEEDA